MWFSVVCRRRAYVLQLEGAEDQHSEYLRIAICPRTDYIENIIRCVKISRKSVANKCRTDDFRPFFLELRQTT